MVGRGPPRGRAPGADDDDEPLDSLPEPTPTPPYTAHPSEQTDLAEEAVLLLRDLLQTPDTVLLSNAALVALIDGLLARYRMHPAKRQRVALLQHWRDDVARFRTAMLEVAHEDPVALEDGEEVAHLNQGKAVSLLQRYCPVNPYLPEPRRGPASLR